MRFRMLGPIRVWNGSVWLPVPATQQRLLLAALLVEADRVVSTQRLVDEIWGEHPPRTAYKTIHAYVMRLRRMLGDQAAGNIVTREQGYKLELGDGDLDAREFERLVETGRRQLAGGRPELAIVTLAEALALWHGPVLADVPERLSRVARVAELEELRLAALEDHVETLLALDRHTEAAGQLHRLVEEHPLREGLWHALMRAQRDCGRRADALATFQRARRVLHEELGLAPGAALRQLQREILTDERAPQPVPEPATVVVPAELPADVARFTGRDSQLKHLDTLLPGIDGPNATAVVISAIAGTAGVGKTALAVHWAHQVRDRFPDGQLYVNLRGYADGAPVRPIEALGRFLRTFGVPPEQIPSDVDEAGTLFRSHLAGRRMLLLLDNARHPDQVRPLLPGSPGCLALVTSRDRLAGLVAREGAIPLPLDALTDVEAHDLLARMIGAERVGDEPDAAARLVQLCGHLPLALRLAAANLAARPRTGIGHYAAALSRDRLAGLDVDGDPQAGVRKAFDHSYRALTDPARRLFRLLSLHPGPDLTVPVAGALAGVETAAACRLLDELLAAHLLEEHASGRFAFHDLLRQYAAAWAAETDSEQDRRAAMARLYAHYLSGMDSAARLLYPQVLRAATTADPAGTVTFADHAAALAWLDAERPNLVAAVAGARAGGDDRAAWQLADALRGYLLMGMHVVEWEGLARTALAAAQADRNPHGEVAAHISLAVLSWVRHQHPRAIEEYGTALKLARQASWWEGQSVVLGNLGNVYGTIGRLPEAADHYHQALAIDRRLGWATGEALKLGNLAELYAMQGQLDRAAAHHLENLALIRKTGSRSSEGETLTRLGAVHHLLGDFEVAQDYLCEALDVHRQVGNTDYEVGTIRVLAGLTRDTGRLDEADRLAESAVALIHRTGRQRYEPESVAVLASVRLYRGHHDAAVAGYRRALDLYRGKGDPGVEVDILIGLAGAECRAGQLAPAIDHAGSALRLARDCGFRVAQGQALTVLAAVRLRQGDWAGVVHCARDALACHTGTGHRLGLARASLVAGYAAGQRGDPAGAAAHAATARAVFTGIGADHDLHAALLLPPAPAGG